MKIIYATRLFSGLEESFEKKIWIPTGVPTIYKLIERLDEEHEVLFVFTAKDSGEGYASSWKTKKDLTFSIKGLKNEVTILAGKNYFYSFLPRKLSFLLREIRQTSKIIYFVFKYKPDIVYLDHANTFTASILSRFQKKIKIIYRVMGIYPSMRESLDSKSIIGFFYRWAYHSPFSLVICTQDGSGVEPWLSKSLNKKVERRIMLNGIDEISKKFSPNLHLNNLPKDKKIILYVGKLERYKGCYDFVKALLELKYRQINNFHALIIGTGSEAEKLKSLIKENNSSSYFTFVDRMSHNQIFEAHKHSDIYVSMNYLGNLSNSNLEAIQANSCIVIPFEQKENGIDVLTHKLLGNSVMSAPIKNPLALSRIINELICSDEKRVQMSNLVKVKKQDFLFNWDKRINNEIRLLNSVMSKNQ